MTPQHQEHNKHHSKHSKRAQLAHSTPRSLRQTIFYSIFGLVAVVELVVFGLLFLLADSIAQKWAQEHLAGEAKKLIAQMQNTDYLAFWGRYPYRISLITESGKVIYDNVVAISDLENHKDREEVQQALQQGSGYMERRSASTMYKTLYYASYLPDYRLVLRVCMNQKDIYAFFLPTLGYMALIFIATLILSAIIARYLTRSIIAPLNNLSPIDSKIFAIPYSELSPFFTKILNQKKRLKKQLKIIERQQKQFQAISQNINEGFVLLDTKKQILSYNAKAQALLANTGVLNMSVQQAQSDSAHTTQDLILESNKKAQQMGETCMDSSSRIQADSHLAQEKTESNPRAAYTPHITAPANPSSQLTTCDMAESSLDSHAIFDFIHQTQPQIQTHELQIDNKHIECIALPIWGKTKPKAFVVLLLDRSEKIQAQEMRKEFSANVTHELKTPLSVIMASSEMMKQGLIAQGDFMLFVDKIYDECKRLLDIINDILKLSFFDEGGELQKVRVDLCKVARDVLGSIAPLSKESHIQMELMCDESPCVVSGVARLLEDMLYNLCENAIKYNKPNGSVIIRTQTLRGTEIDLKQCVPINPSAKNALHTLRTSSQKMSVLSVQDSGIGIPLELQERVFERFYRVDKSRSKKLGGTGLGLSIVKQIALYHNAYIFLRSDTLGTRVMLVFHHLGYELE